jgi:RND family efflux transporter MFP subunit
MRLPIGMGWGCCFALSVGVGCAAEARSTPVQAVRVEVVSPGILVSGTRAEGLAVPGRQAELAFRFGGYIEHLGTAVEGSGRERPLAPGDVVAKGALLLSMRSADFKNQVDEAVGMRAEAAAGHGKAKEDYERAQALYQAGAISKADLGTAKAQYLSVGAAGSAANARVNSAKLAMKDASLTSPFDGTIAALHGQVGSLVSPGVPVVVVCDTSTMRVTVSVAEGVQRALSMGNAAKVDSAGHSYAASIAKLHAPIAGIRASFDVELEIDNRAGTLRPGALVRVDLDNGSRPPPVLSVPIGAIVRAPEGAGFAVFVYLDHKGRIERRTVAIGALVDSRVAVVSGLRAGEKVVTEGASLLVDGTKAEIVH